MQKVSTGRALLYIRAIVETGLKRMQEQNPPEDHEAWLNRTAYGKIHMQVSASSAHDASPRDWIQTSTHAQSSSKYLPELATCSLHTPLGLWSTPKRIAHETEDIMAVALVFH